MAADPLSFVAAPNVAQDLTLSLVDKAGVPTIQIVDTATTTVLAEKAQSATTQVNLTLSTRTDTIRIKNDFSSIVPVNVDGFGGADTLIGPSTGAVFRITAANAGNVDSVSFVNITRLQGADNAADSFVLNPGASLTNGVNGGAGGLNNVVGPSDGATFTQTGIDRGNVRETGAAIATTFTNVGKLQGGVAADTFVLNGAALTTGVDGGGNSTHFGGRQAARRFQLPDWTAALRPACPSVTSASCRARTAPRTALCCHRGLRCRPELMAERRTEMC